MKRIILIFLALLLISGCTNVKKFDNKEVDLSNIITPSQAYLICNENVKCPDHFVLIQGKLEANIYTPGTYELKDDKKSIFVSLSYNTSFMERIITNEKNYLFKDGGIIEVRINGTISHSWDMCTNAGCEGVVKMIIEPQDIEFIKKVSCSGAGAIGLIGNCFDFSDFSIKSSEALQFLENSKVCTENGKEPTGYIEYKYDGNYWAFQINALDRPGGCSDYCYVYPQKIVFERSCGQNNVNNLNVEETI